MKYLLDSSAIVMEPQLLALDATKLAIPISIINELVSRGSEGIRARHADLINEAIRRGADPLDPKEPANYFSINRGNKLSHGDLDIIQISKELLAKHGPSELCVVTLDKALIVELNRIGVRTAAPKDVLAENVGWQNSQASIDADQIATYQRRHLVGSGVTGAAITLLGVLIYINATSLFGLLARAAPILAPIALSALFGILLFWFRQRQRLAYGVTEFLGGLTTSYFSFKAISADFVSSLTFLAALYIIVRGMDNIGKGLEGGRFESSWQRYFRAP